MVKPRNDTKPVSGGQPPTGTQGDEVSDSGIAKAAGLLGVLTLVSRFGGLARDVVISAVFGASATADAFFVAFRIPNLMRRIVAEGASSTAFVPVFTTSLARGGAPEARAAAAAVGGVACLVLIALVVAGVLGAPWIVGLFAPGFVGDPEKYELTVALTRWTFPYLLFVGMAAWAMGVLHTFRRFVAPGLGPICLNLAIIAAALGLGHRFERPVFALVVGVLVGGFLQFAVQIPSLRRVGVRLGDAKQSGHPAVKRVGQLIVPTLLGGAVYQITILISTIFASLLPANSVSYLWYADRVFEFPLGIIAVAVGTAALPSFSQQVADGELDSMASGLGYSLRLVWALCIPATIGLWLLAPHIVGLLFERGEFQPQHTAATASALRAYCFGLIGVASVRVLVSVFYAFQKPRIPVITAVAALVVHVLCNIAFMGPVGTGDSTMAVTLVARAVDTLGVMDLRHVGLALGTAVASLFNAGLLFLLAKRELPAFALRALVNPLLRQVAAGICMAAVVLGFSAWLQLAQEPLLGDLTVIVVVAMGAASYLAAAYAFGVDEIRAVVAALRRRLG